jgi:pre-mRNA-splicing factor ATP-dependent RNA helicase DHX15/PRP43
MSYEDNIRKALARGLFQNIAIHSEKFEHTYKTINDNFPALIEAESAIAMMQHKWIVFNKITHVGKSFINTATAVEPEWIVDLPYFQDDNLAQKRNGGPRQPLVKEALDAARARAQS